MNRTVVVMLTAAAFMLPRAGHAQKEAMGPMAQLSVAPDVCKWTNAPSSLKIDQMIDVQIKALSISQAEWLVIREQAKKDLLADPSNCAPDGMIRMMYNEAVK